jgi:hypothetical protein
MIRRAIAAIFFTARPFFTRPLAGEAVMVALAGAVR